MNKLNLLQRFQVVRAHENFECLHPEDRSFIGYCLEYSDGYYDNTRPEEANIQHLFSFEELNRFKAIEETLQEKSA